MTEELWWAVAAAAVVVVVVLTFLTLAGGRRREPGLPDGVAVRYTRHARERMQQREVTADEVEAVLKRPELREVDEVENSVRLERDLQGRTLKVWVAQPWPPDAEAVIKSTAWHYRAQMKIPARSVSVLIGKGGRTVGGIRASSGARIHVGDGGNVRITADNAQSLRAAQQQINAVVTGRR